MHKQNKQEGAAAMITVIFVAIILSIMTIGFVRLAINETQISTDDDLTTRAFYAAESGVEEAKRAINELKRGEIVALNEDTCDLPENNAGPYIGQLSPIDELDIEYVCQFIDLNPSSYSYHFDGLYQTTQVELNAVDTSGTPANFDRLVFYWHLNNTSANGGDGIAGTSGIQARAAGANDLPQESNWNHPAMLRVQILEHDNGVVDSGQRSQVILLNPKTSTAGFSYNINNSPDAKIVDAYCDNSVAIDNHYCRAVLTGFSPTKKYTVRISNLYDSTHLNMLIRQGFNVRNFDNAQAVVDVTGRAGSVYRRVEAVLELTQPNILPSHAITSLSDVCKDFIVTDVRADFIGNSGTSCTR